MNNAVNDVHIEMRKWFEQPLGKYYITLAKEKISKIVSTSFGYHLLIVGEPQLADCVINSPISHHVLVHHLEDSKRDIYSFCCSKQDKLPFESDSVDLVYLGHSLELHKNPHELLREAYRVLRPEGRIIISGFNPISILGLRFFVTKAVRILFCKKKLMPKFKTALKLKDWLKLLAFGNIQIKNFFYCIPFNNKKIINKKDVNFFDKIACKIKFPFGSAYIIIAYKKIITLTPIRPEWKLKKYLVPDNLVETAPQRKEG